MDIHMQCACCGDARATACVLTCLHYLCGPCADDLAAERDPRCPQCAEPVGRHALAQDVRAAEKAEAQAHGPDDAPTQGLQADDAVVDWYELHIECMVARDVAQRLVSEARDFAYYATHNHRDAMADVAHAYDTPDMRAEPFRARRDAFLAEADAALRADMKSAELALDAAQALLASAAECLARCEACRPHDAPASADADVSPRVASNADLGRLAARAATLKARGRDGPPPLASTLYFACVRPLTPQTEPHAFLGRTLLWHAGWDRWDHGAAQWRRESTPYAVVAVLPDGRPVVRDEHGNAYSNPGPAWLQRVPLIMFPTSSRRTEPPEPLAKVACAGYDDAVLQPRMHDGLTLQDPQTDGAGRVWAHNWRRLVCWAPDGRVLHDVGARALLDRWAFRECAHDTFNHLAVAPCGVVLLSMNRTDVVAATPDLVTVLWRHTASAGVPCFFAVVFSDTLFAAPTVATQPPLCLDVHTGAPRDPQACPELAAWDFRRAWRVAHCQGRANALQCVWLPPALATALPGLARPAPDRVWQARDLLQPPPRECSVVGAHGRLYRRYECNALSVD